MKRSTDRILTTHAGRLTTYEITGPTAMGSGTSMDWESFSASIRPEMIQIIRKQINAGIDVISDGELGKVSFGFSYYGRHEHEWKVWKDVKLPADKVLIPGVVSHVSNTIEHSELVADRILRFASVVGKENVIAGTDCGMGGRIHMQLGWAKLKALADGAALASKELWP